MAAKTSDTRVLILAGGDGQRLAALTAQGDCRPKQYCSLVGGASLLQAAVKRALKLVPSRNIAVIVSDHHRRWWEPQLASLAVTIISQPSNRGTGLGFLLALLVMAKSDWNPNVICLPSDHHVEHEEVLKQSLRRALVLGAAAHDKLTLLGIAPDQPDPDYGYITPAPGSATAMRTVHSFVEKPDRENAAQLIRTGSVWNSGLLVGRLQTFLQLYSQQSPDLLGSLTLLVKRWFDSSVPSQDLLAFYAQHRSLDFSREFLQKHPADLQLLTVPACGWNDVGTPERLAATLALLPQQLDRRLSANSNCFTLANAVAAASRTGGPRFTDKRHIWPLSS